MLVLGTSCAYGAGTHEPLSPATVEPTVAAALAAPSNDVAWCERHARDLAGDLAYYYSRQTNEYGLSRDSGPWLRDTFLGMTGASQMLVLGIKNLRQHGCPSTEAGDLVVEAFKPMYTAAAPDRSPSCLSAKGIRDLLVSHEDPGISATYFDAAEIESQGICCGPGFVVRGYNEYGDAMVVGPVESWTGHYVMFEPGEYDNVSFTPAQWVRYSKVEAHRCQAAR